MKTAIQLIVCTGYFLTVALVTFGVFWLVAGPFAAMRSDLGATMVTLWLIVCTAVGGYLGLRGFNRILPLIE